MDRRGITQLVAVLLTVLVVITGIVIIFVVVDPLPNGGNESGNSSNDSSVLPVKGIAKAGVKDGNVSKLNNLTNATEEELVMNCTANKSCSDGNDCTVGDIRICNLASGVLGSCAGVYVANGTICSVGICNEVGICISSVAIEENIVPKSFPNSDLRMDYMTHQIYSSLWDNYYTRIDSEMPFLVLFVVPNVSPLSGVSISQSPGEKYIDFFDKGTYPSLYDAKTHYDLFSNYYESLNPDVQTGTYLSGADCHEVGADYPRRQVDCADFDSSDFLYNTFGDSQRWRIDLSNLDARSKFINLIIDEAVSRNKSHIYLDNIVHPSSGGWKDAPYITWEVVTDFLTEIEDMLETRGINVIVNVAVVPWWLAEDNFHDADLLMNAVDGFSFEQPFHKLTRDNVGRLENEIAVYKKWLDNERIVLFVPAEGEKNTDSRLNDLRLAAALGMIVKDSGESLFVARYFHSGEGDWKAWPEEFGSSQGVHSITENENNIVLKRDFENGDVYVQFVKNFLGEETLSFSLPAIGSEFEMYDDFVYGSVDISNFPEIVYDRDSTDYVGMESFAFKTNFVDGSYKDVVIVDINW